MIELLRKAFGKRRAKESGESARADLLDLRVAVCALFLEMARVDGEFSDEEKRRILSILKNDYHLSDKDASVLIQATNRKLEKSIDLWQFTRRINQCYSEEKKLGIIEMLWKIVYSDGNLDKHERYLVNKLSRLLRLSHEELIEAKTRAIGKGTPEAG